MTSATPLPYANELIQPTDDQVRSWQVLVPPGGRLPLLVGNCPACLHECEIQVIDMVVQGGVPSAAAAPVAEMTRQFICNCRLAHDQPTGVTAGCGRYWLGKITRMDDNSYHLGAERSMRLLPAATALNEAVSGQDKRVQSAAEKWLAAVTAIYALFSLTGVATAKDALTGLTVWSKSAVAAALIAGVVLAACALVFGYSAAYGWPRIVTVDDDDALKAWYKTYRSFAHTATTNLHRAVVLAFASLAAVTVVMLLVWFLPRHTP